MTTLPKDNTRRWRESRGRIWTILICVIVSLILTRAFPALGARNSNQESISNGDSGGSLITARRAEPATFNPIAALDASSRDIIDLSSADLVHINRHSMKTEPATAESWSVSPDGRTYVVRLRPGIRFSDGHPMDADDVVFTFQAYLDPRNAAPQRDLLMVQGKPITVEKIDSHTVRFVLAASYAAAERLFDGMPILPRHLLSKPSEEGRLNRAWSIDTPPAQIAGLGPFRLKAYVPGQRVVLERNPYYWKSGPGGHRLPYLDTVTFVFLPNEEAQMIQFLAGQTQILPDLNADNFMELKKQGVSSRFHTYDTGPGLEFGFLLLNLNQLGPQSGSSIRYKQDWFRNLSFRQALSAAIDREAIVRLAYRGLANPLWGNVTPGNALWINRSLPQPKPSLDAARSLLKSASFSWKENTLVDAENRPVEFSILVSATNPQRTRIATLIQHDLSQLGMKVSIVALEFRTMLDRIFKRFDYEAAVMSLTSGDADPTSDMNVWVTSGSTHLWNLSGTAQTPWEEEIDRLMRLQMTNQQYSERKRLYDRVQQLIAENLPVICLVSPHVLVAASDEIGGFQPAILRSTTLWNAEYLYFRNRNGRGR